ncbi:MAG: helical backbone metal receptor [Candidatus Thermoplasmatota archaeon]|jgi:ABC-type Fe3+-hydroxamate transport system substrate-binding protein|nr:helical backbone metal receptor [Candidatus Thermoplasmatota archaeon]
MYVIYNEITGKKIQLATKPKRIISLSPSITEILFDINAGKSVVGVSAYCKRPASVQNLPNVGSYNHVSMKSLNDLKPDLIFTVTGYQRDLAIKLSEMFNVYPLPIPTGIIGILNMINQVSIIVGKEDRGVQVQKNLISILNNIKSNITKTVYVEIDLGGPVTFGNFSYITDALRFTGYDNIYAYENKEWLEPDFQFVMDSDPDIIIYEHGWNKTFTKKDLHEMIDERKWNNLSAYRNNRIYLTPGKYDFLAHHGTSFIKKVIPWLKSLQ